ncbi:MAG: hypothetical protein M0035_14595 [Actinomycetota bacterium]|nr:hypothetical protein [Actinomycetota bacterium]
MAQTARLSRTSVSKVFNDQPGISEKTIETVRRAGAQFGWAASSSAAALASASARDIATVSRRDQAY